METLYELETFKVRLAVAESNLEACRSAEEIFRMSLAIYADLDADQEHFLTFFLNNKNRVRGYKVMASGSLTASLVHPREVYRSVCLYGAAAVIFVHNHPSGEPAPSPEDIEITRRLNSVGELLGVRVLDHVVIGRDRYFSFSDRGMLDGAPHGRAFDPLSEVQPREALGVPPIGSPTGKGGRYRGAYKMRKEKAATRQPFQREGL